MRWHDLPVNVMPDAPVAAAESLEVDAMRLLRLVRIRRELKVVCGLAIVALPLWATFTIIAETVLSPSSRTYWSIDAKIGTGFVLIGAVLVVAFVLLLGSRLLGRTGQAAARLSPVFKRGPEPKLVDATPEMTPLVGQLRRKGLVRLGIVLMFLVVVFVSGATAWNFWPAWQANHGHGGQVVTIGREATISGYTVGSHGHRDYFLDTPDGPSIAEDYKPHDGQRWTVLHRESGNDEAYLVGGHDYLLVGLIAVVAAAISVGIVVSQVGAARTELAARAATSGDLAASVAYLGSGHTAQLRIGRPETLTLTLRPLGDRTAEAWLVRRRLVAAGTAFAIVAGAGTGIGLWQAGVFRTPPMQRDVTLGFLAGTSWDPDAFADYADTSSTRDLLTDALQQGGVASPRVTVTASVLISSRDSPDRGGTADANVDVAGIGSAPARSAASGIVLFHRSLAQYEHGTATAVTGLPAGWQGVLIGKLGEEDPGVELAGAASGRLVRISLHGAFAPAQIEQRGVELARAIAGVGIGKFAHDVGRR